MYLTSFSWFFVGDLVLWFSILAILNLIIYEFTSTIRWIPIDKRRFSTITVLTGVIAIILLLIYGIKHAVR